jgi:predicted RNA binding protein YcfA (HicA-like mRNA interferase family)
VAVANGSSEWFQEPLLPHNSGISVILGAAEIGVARTDKVLEQVLRGSSDANVRFGELRSLLLRLGFGERVKGSHRVFWKDGVEEILNLQPKGAKAKPYQVKQVRHVILKYKLGGE